MTDHVTKKSKVGFLNSLCFSYMQLTIFKLHSEFALPAELQLDREGVDFIFPPSQEQVTATPTKIYQKEVCYRLGIWNID